ncbi:MAG: carboxymuconolactone decarboxylase family protein [Acidimicrobiia bacterium]|nr:carboxymuconolactone decarboxylase family protein [Acidimicrobiia bacterium]
MSTPQSQSQTFLPESADRLRELFGRLDPTFAAIWSRHLSQLLARDQLDVRTRFLVLTAQYTVTERTPQLEENLDAALSSGVPAHELLEAILQPYVYTGPWVVAAAAEAYERVVERRPASDLGVGGTTPEQLTRRLEDERERWASGDAYDPRLPGLLERYGWHGISNGLRLRPGHHINMLDTLDALDPGFLQIWLDAVYDGMYGRGVLDDRTRLLCVVGATLALGETHQSRRHMRAALRVGAQPRELLEVVFHTTAFFGHPYVMPAAFDDLIRIADDEGRITELVATDRVDEVRRIVAARVARRDGVQDGIS